MVKYKELRVGVAGLEPALSSEKTILSRLRTAISPHSQTSKRTTFIDYIIILKKVQ